MKFFKAFTILFFLLGIGKIFAQTPGELKKQREQLNQQIEKLSRDLEETSKNKKSTLKQLSLIKAQIALREDKIRNMNAEIRLLDSQISDNTNTVHTLQTQLDQLKKQYIAMVLFAFRNRSAYNKLMFLFVAKDFNQAYDRLKYMQQIGAARERQAKYITGAQKNLNQKITELDNNKKVKSGLVTEQQNETKTLGKTKTEEDQVVANLSQNQKQIKQQIAEKQKIAKALDKQLIAAIRREKEEADRKAAAKAAAEQKAAVAKARAANKPVPIGIATPKKKTTSESLNTTPGATELSNSFLGNRGRLPWPVSAGVVTEHFGKISIDGIVSNSDGITIKTNKGAPVTAVFDGEVFLASSTGATFTVAIKHGSYITAYANLRSYSVTRGQKVTTKQTIGIAGIDAGSGDSVVVFDILQGEKYLDPASWLAGR